MQHQAYLSSLTAPSAVAVIGSLRQADHSPGSDALVVQSLLDSGYAGPIFHVQPSRRFEGVHYLDALNQIPQEMRPFPLAVLCCSAQETPDMLQALAPLKTRAVIVTALGFKEVGAAGLKLEKDMQKIAEANGMALLGPDSLGVINTRGGLNTMPLRLRSKPGGIGFFSQSGAICTAGLDWADSRGLGFSTVLSLGNEVGLDECDAMACLAQDPHTKVIVGYIESIRHGQRFLQQAQTVARKKPVILLRSGTTDAGARAIAAHTGEHPGSDVAYQAAFKQCGIIRAESLEELMRYSLIFARQPLPQGPSVGIIANAGGPGILAAEACGTSGLSLASLSSSTVGFLKETLPPYSMLFNPVDLEKAVDPALMAVTARELLNDQAVHALLIVLAPVSGMDELELARQALEGVCDSKKTVVFCLMGGDKTGNARILLSEAGYPCFSFPEAAMNALSAMHRYHTWLHNGMPVEVGYRRDLAKAQKTIAAAKNSGSLEMVEYQAQELLHSYEMPTLKAKLARTSEEAVQIAKQIGQPVALKIASPQIVHKTDVNGVMLNLENPAQVKAAFTNITSRASRMRRDAHIEGCLVQAMAPKSACEIMVGFKRDPRFGPLVMFGMGGIFTEVFKDISYRLAPLSLLDVYSMIREVKAFPLLASRSGNQAVNYNAVEDVLLIMSQMAQDFPEIQEAVCNPVLVSDQGAVAADMYVVLSK